MVSKLSSRLLWLNNQYGQMLDDDNTKKLQCFDDTVFFRGGGQKWCLWWDVFSLKVDLAWGAVDRTCYFLPRPTKRSWTPVQLSSSSWRNKSILYLVPPKGYVLNRIAGALRSRIHHILIWNKEYIHWWGQWKYQGWTPCPTGYIPRGKGGVPHPARPRETVDTPFRPHPTLSHKRLGNGMLFFNPYHQESWT